MEWCNDDSDDAIGTFVWQVKMYELVPSWQPRNFDVASFIDLMQCMDRRCHATVFPAFCWKRFVWILGMLAKYYLLSIPSPIFTFCRPAFFFFQVCAFRWPLRAPYVGMYWKRPGIKSGPVCETWQDLQTAKGGAHQRSLSEAVEHWGVSVWFMSTHPPRSISKLFLKLIKATEITEIAPQTWQALQTWVDNPLALAGVAKRFDIFGSLKNAVNLSELVHPSQELPCKRPATVGSGVVSFGGALIASKICYVIWFHLSHKVRWTWNFFLYDHVMICLNHLDCLWSHCSLQLLWGERTCPAGQLGM